MGMRDYHVCDNIMVEFEDMKALNVGQRITLREIGNVEITGKTNNDDGSFNFVVETRPDDKNWKAYPKICWIANKPDLKCKVTWVKTFPLITVPQVKKGMKIEEIYNKKTLEKTAAWSEAEVGTLPVGSFI